MAEISATSMNITVDDGLKRIVIQNKYDDVIGEFYFRPTDIGIIKRYNDMVPKLDEVTALLEKVGINPSGEGVTEDDEATLEEAENRLYEICDEMFGGDMSKAFFGKMNPFSPVNGAFYCEQVLESVGRFIGAQFAEEVKKINKRVNKYTGSYKKGKK